MTAPVGADLTPHQRDIICMVGLGYQHKEIAQKLGISVKTVRNTIHAIYDIWDVHDKVSITTECWRRGWIR